MPNIVINSTNVNLTTPTTIENIVNWHYARNLIDGSTSVAQYSKLVEEVIELGMTIGFADNPDEMRDNLIQLIQSIHQKGRIKEAPSNSPADDIGDINVVLLNIAERENLSFAACLDKAYADIKHRKGKMIDGIFVKEEDL